MTELALRHATVHRLAPYGRLYPIEVKIVSGVPDYAYVLKCRGRAVEGWLELKWLAEWPKRAATPVRFGSLKTAQVRWHERHHDLGGRVRTLVQVGRTFLVLDSPTLSRVHRRELTARELEEAAKVRAIGAFPTLALLEELTR